MSSLPPLFGLILAGGMSKRMQRDKAALAYHGRTQLEWAFDSDHLLCFESLIVSFIFGGFFRVGHFAAAGKKY